jgi:hypothetical protein
VCHMQERARAPSGPTRGLLISFRTVLIQYLVGGAWGLMGNRGVCLDMALAHLVEQ